MSGANDQPVAEGLGVHHDLMLRVHGGDSVVALDDAVGAYKLGALVVGEVALHRLTTATDSVFVLRGPGDDLFRLLLQCSELLFLARPTLGTDLLLIFFAVTLHQRLY